MLLFGDTFMAEGGVRSKGVPRLQHKKGEARWNLEESLS